MRLKTISMLFMGAAFFTACNSNDSSSTSTSDTTTTTTVDNAMTNDTGGTSNMTNNSTTGMVTLDTMDQNFAMKAASGSMTEIEMANMAMQNASNERVKAYATMMIRDHSNASNELKGMAPNKSLTLPTAPMPAHMKHIDMVKGKKGKEFDKSYMSHMVMAHENDVRDFEKASNSAKDADVKAFATKNLPILRMHLDSARAISKMKM